MPCQLLAPLTRNKHQGIEIQAQQLIRQSLQYIQGRDLLLLLEEAEAVRSVQRGGIVRMFGARRADRPSRAPSKC